MELITALEILAGRLKTDGLLVIVDIEKSDNFAAPEDGRKVSGHGSKEVVAALCEIGFEDVAVITDQEFKVEMKMFGQRQMRHDEYFMVRARKGEEEDDEDDD